MNLANLVYALSIAKLHPVLAGAALAALILVLAGWGLRWAFLLRRRRERPLALIIADVIAQGSVHDAPAPLPETPEEPPAEVAVTGARLHMSACRKLATSEDSWGFSLREGKTVIATFVYPGQEQARAAHRAMRRALKDLSLVLRTAEAPAPEVPRPYVDPADFRPQRVWAERPESVTRGFGSRRRASAQF